MNTRLVARNLSPFCAAIALLMLPSMAWATYYGEWDSLAVFGESAGIALGLAALLRVAGWRATGRVYLRDAIALVVFGWLVVALASSLPYFLGGHLGPVDAFFESVSGLTTTGSTVVQDIEALPKCVLFWRACTQFIGGMGIVVVFLEILPHLGAGGRLFLRSESSAPETRPISPTVRQTVRVLLAVYVGLTAVQTAMLIAAGMNLFDALCHSFATLSSGGFSPRQASIAHYDSVAIEGITVLFMICAATNFTLLFSVARGDWRAPFLNSEWRCYMALLAVATLLITLNNLGAQGSAEALAGPAGARASAHADVGQALRDSLFVTVSVSTTTGFGTADFDTWPLFSHALLLMLMLVGGSAGSTAGGIKVVRVVLLIKMARNLVASTYQPRRVVPVRLNGHTVSEDALRHVSAYFALYVLVFASAVLGMAALGVPFLSACSGVAATLNGVGPGMEHLGASEDFSLLPAAGKLLLCACMMLGRLEFLSILALLSPGFWRGA